MGGKKKGGKKKGAKDGDDKYDLGQMNLILSAQVQSLKERLVLEKERKDKSLGTEEEIREREIELEQKLKDEDNTTRAIM